MRVLLDHSIVGKPPELTIRKDRRYAACRLCGAIFQPWLNTDAVSDEEYALNPDIRVAAEIEIVEWRRKHNRKHSEKEHLALAQSGLTMTPEAAHKLAPFGLVPVADAEDPEIAQALKEAPRAPVDDVESSLKNYTRGK